MGWLRSKVRPPEVTKAIEERDALLVELEHAIKGVDRVHSKIIEDYQAAEKRLSRATK